MTKVMVRGYDDLDPAVARLVYLDDIIDETERFVSTTFICNKRGSDED